MNVENFTLRVQQILVVSASPSLRAQIEAYFSMRHYVVTWAEERDDAMHQCMVAIYDCIIIDIAVLRRDVVRSIQWMRERTQTPLIVLGARRDAANKIDVIRVGADDYLIKPCHMAELEVRIYAIARRIALTQNPMRSSPVQLNPSNQSVLINQRTVEMTPMEFAILSTLMAAPGRVFSRSELSRIIFGEDTMPGRAIDVHVSNIRNKIEHDVDNPRYIVTIYGRGYMFNDEVIPE
ncbi:MAG: response regulator transcription factor [Roseiflexaceae bacterium]